MGESTAKSDRDLPSTGLGLMLYTEKGESGFNVVLQNSEKRHEILKFGHCIFRIPLAVLT